MTDGLHLDIDGPVASVVIDRPDRRNAMSQAMWDALPSLIAQAEADGARVVVMRSSTPGVFSAGADIGEYRDHIGDIDWGADNQERVSRGTAALRDSALPIIAAVDGPAFGAGAGLVVSCDLRIATQRSTFAITPAKLGMVYPFPDLAALVALVGTAAARRILLTGGTFGASDALRIGFVDDVVTTESDVDPTAALNAEIARWIEILLANSGTSIRLMKRTLALAQTGQTEDDDVTRAIVHEALASGDYAEGAQAFLERRPPQFD